MAVPINKIRNETGSLRSSLVQDTIRRSWLQIQLSSTFRSSNYSATQNYTNIDDLTDELIAGDATAGD